MFPERGDGHQCTQLLLASFAEKQGMDDGEQNQQAACHRAEAFQTFSDEDICQDQGGHRLKGVDQGGFFRADMPYGHTLDQDSGTCDKDAEPHEQCKGGGEQPGIINGTELENSGQRQENRRIGAVVHQHEMYGVGFLQKYFLACQEDGEKECIAQGKHVSRIEAEGSDIAGQKEQSQ